MSARRATIIPTPNNKSIFIADAEHEKKVRALKHEEEEEKALGSLEVSESSEASSGKHHKEEKEGEEEHEEEEGLDPVSFMHRGPWLCAVAGCRRCGAGYTKNFAQ